MKTTIDPRAEYVAVFNRFSLQLPGECVLDCSHQGQCDADVAHWAPIIAGQVLQMDAPPGTPTPEKIRAELEEYGAWDTEELSNDDDNLRRIVWIAACNIAEDENPETV